MANNGKLDVNLIGHFNLSFAMAKVGNFDWKLGFTLYNFSKW